MFRADVITDDIYSYEPKLIQFIQDGNSDFKNEISKGKERCIAWLKSKRFLLRKLCLPLDLTIDTITTNDDNVERLRLVVNITVGSSDDTTYTLYGTNDDGDAYTSIFDLEIPANTTGDVTKSFNTPYKKYKLTLSGLLTATHFLTERSFELPTTYLAIGVIMRSLSMGNDSIWSAKSQEYDDLAFGVLSEFSFGYDKDDDGTYDEDETNTIGEVIVKA